MSTKESVDEERDRLQRNVKTGQDGAFESMERAKVISPSSLETEQSQDDSDWHFENADMDARLRFLIEDDD